MTAARFENPSETRTLTVHMSDRMYTGLVDRARAAGYTPTLYAKLLLEAAYAARCGKGEGDTLLEACVAKSVARRPAPPAPRPAEPRIVHEAVAVPVPVPAAPPEVHVSGGHPIERLAEAIAAGAERLRDEVATVPGERPHGWTAAQWTLARLVCRGEGATIDEIMQALSPAYQERAAVRALVSTTRRRLEAAGVEIEQVDVWGWRVASPARAAADALMGRSP